MKIATCAIMLLVLASFNLQNPKIRTGVYSCVRPGKFEQAWQRYLHGISTYSVGSELIVTEDSTFNYLTCATIMIGRWYTINDSLFLQVKGIRWKKDSLDKFGFNGKWPEIPSKPIGFRITKDQLERIDTFDHGDKSILRLKFNEH